MTHGLPPVPSAASLHPAAAIDPAGGPVPRGRLAVVVQRYGAEVNGGAEGHARTLATALVRSGWVVDVLSSRALDYQQWQPHYPAGESWLDDVRVLRFDHPSRQRRGRQHMPLRHKLRWKLRRWLSRHGRPEVAQPSGDEHRDGLAYLRDQGPLMPGLMAYLAEAGEGYDAIFFFTALFHPTACGVLVRPERSVLVPTLHDEKPMFLPHFHRVFHAPAAILFNTASEAALAAQLYGTPLPPQQVCGLGVDLPDAAAQAAAATRQAGLAQQHGIRGPYLLYLGRVDSAKGCDRLFAWHQALPAALRQVLQLVVAGAPVIPIPTGHDIVATGFVDAADRDALLAGALGLVNPSAHESLSLVVLEAMAWGLPVIVNQDCRVLTDHVAASGVGHGVRDAAGYAAAAAHLLGQTAAARTRQAAQAQAYVASHYAWPQVMAKLDWAIDQARVRSQAEPTHAATSSPAPRRTAAQAP